MSGHQMPTLNGFTREELAELFEYDSRLGMLIRRKTTGSNAKAGQGVGTLDGKGYLHVSVRGKFLRVHRVIYFLLCHEAPPEVDHIDGNRWNNFRENLRGATRQQNAGNGRASSLNTSGFKGVSKNSRSGKWHAQIKINGKQTYLGRFDTPQAAAQRYNQAAVEHFGIYARLNHV